MTRKIRSLVVFIMLCLCCTAVYGNTIELFYDGASHLYYDAPISLYLDGSLVETKEMAPVQFNGYTLVPAREVFEKTGATVLWKALEQKVYVDNGTNLIVLEIDSSYAWVDGNEVKLDMPAKMINDKVMIPIRFVGEALGYDVKWDAALRTIHINTKTVSSGTAEVDTGKQPEGDTDQEKTNETSDQAAYSDWIDQEHLSYDNSNEALILSGIEGIGAASVSVEERYHSKQIIVDLNKDCSQQLMVGEWVKQSGAISSLQIKHSDTGTKLVLTTKTIQALKVEEQDDRLVLECVKPSDKYDKIVVVDAGHGGHDPGASSSGLQEKNLNLQLALALERVLEQNSNIKVYLTREDDTYLKLDERTAMANEIDPDLFISIHINSAAASASGIETYYTKKADTRNKVFAAMVQKALVNTFGKRDRGVKANTFVVTKNTQAPAILIEVGFITNTADREMMTSSGFASQWANVVYQCILDYYHKGLNNSSIY